MSDSDQDTGPEGVDWANTPIAVVDGPETESEAEGAQPTFSGDGILNLMVHFAERGIHLPITLYSQGLTFSGILISQQRFVEGNADLAKDENSAFSIIFSEIGKFIDEPNPDPSTPAPDYRFVHLEKAGTFQPGQAGMPQPGTFIRLQRKDIVGWSIGQLQRS